MDVDALDNLVEVRVVEHDPARARAVLEALVDLALDADAQRARDAEAAEAHEEVPRKSA